MNKQDIIRMAREAGAATGSPAPNAPEIIFPLCMDVERFAALVAAAEREAILNFANSETFNRQHGERSPYAYELVAAIRARGNHAS